MSHYLESEPEDDDEVSSSGSECSEDRAFVDNSGVEEGICHAALRGDSSGEEACEDEDNDGENERAFRELARIKGRMVRGHRPSEEDLRAAGYFCDFGVPRAPGPPPKTAEEIADGIQRALLEARARKVAPPRRPAPPVPAPVSTPAPAPAPALERDIYRGLPPFPPRPGTPRPSPAPAREATPEPASEPEVERFAFMEEMEASLRRKRIQENTQALSKVLDRERELHRRRLTAKPRIAPRAPRVIQPMRGVPTIDSFFKL
eukprot:764867-Hanusia_phi.AAC.13